MEGTQEGGNFFNFYARSYYLTQSYQIWHDNPSTGDEDL